MIRGIVKWSLQYRTLLLVLAAVLMGVGVYRMRTMPVDVLPEFSPPFVEIQTESLGLSAEEVEQLITVPMEQDLLNGVPWVDTLRSSSVPGLSSIVITFKQGTDLMKARQMVAERMTQAVALPHVSKPPTMLQPLSATGRVMIVGLSSKNLSLIQMGVLARWTIAPRLLGVPGVASVAVWGQRDRQLQVLIDPKRLQSQIATTQDVLETTGNALWVSTLSYVEASTPGTGGFIDGPNQRLGIYHNSPIVTADGLSQVPISDYLKPDGTPLRLADVATVVEDHQPLIGDAVVNDGSGLLLVVEKFPGTNTLEVTRGLEEAMDGLKPGLPDMTIDTNLYRPATFVDAGLNNLGLALIFGGLLLVLVFAFFYRNWRLALISTLTTALSLIIGGLVFSLTATTLNAISLAGLLMAVGVVVDAAITDAQAVVWHMRQESQIRPETPVISMVLTALGTMRGAALTAALITLMVVVPIFFIEGVPGSFFQPLAVTYTLAVLASVVTGLVVTPGLCALLLPRTKITECDTPFVRRLQNGYEKIMAGFISKGRLAWPILIAAAVIALGGMAFFKLALVPDFKERDLLISLSSAPGTSQTEMSRITTRMSAELHTLPGVRDVGALVGRAVLGDQVVAINSTEIWVSLDPQTNYDAAVAAINQVAKGYPGVQTKVQTYLKQVSADVVPAATNSVTVRIYGDTNPILRTQAEAIQQTVKGIQGVKTTRIDLPTEQLTLETEVDILAAQKYGLKPGDVRRAAATLLSGIQVGSLFEQQKIFDVVVWSTPQTRHNLSDIANLLIDTPDGGHVRLGNVAQVRIVPDPIDIRHEAAKRYLDVIATVQGRDLGAVASEISSRLLQMQFPMEYHAAVLNDYATAQTAQLRLLGGAAAVVIAIFFLMQALFGSWRVAAMGVAALPATLVGGVLTALAIGGPVSIGAVAGLLVVLGIAVRNILLQIQHYQYLQRHDGETAGTPLALRGARERLAPVLMTALGVGLFTLPALIMGDQPGLEIIRPMAMVMIGGLITATLFNLFVVPALYLSLRANPAQELELIPAASGAAAGEPDTNLGAQA